MFCGIDEAGRGSVMGPLVVGSVAVESDSVLRDLGVKDSKKLTPRARERMYDAITDAADSWTVVVASAAEIDERRESVSLNDIEMDMFRLAALELKCDKVIADCPDINEEGFRGRFAAMLPEGTEVIAKHKADDTYPVVSAASIIAKVTRDRMIEAIREEFGTNIGSGYPSDHYTMDFIEGWIKEKGDAPPHVRCSWEPVRKMLSARKNRTLDDW